ncbi:hypothetical protein ACFQLX_13625 [Streptomyces polyrhachis]|uniref:DUF5709 domain-containing protein n=1 Tax=Streptomyces polyrhachis TaxID=1282885 RepID=A0ABW2GI25_9ACTN
MSHHHKSNDEVEGNPDTGHSRGMPLRPDVEELQERTTADRLLAGLPAEGAPDEEVLYEEEWTEIGREAADGEIRTGKETRRERSETPPPSHYDGD